MSGKFSPDERIVGVSFDADSVRFDLADGRALIIPVGWYPKIASAGPDEQNRYEIVNGGFGVHWPDLDEDLEIFGLLAGNAAPDVRTITKISGPHITEYREITGMSQAELAEQLGVRQATISDWEQGKAEPSRLAQQKLSGMIRRARLAREPMPKKVELGEYKQTAQELLGACEAASAYVGKRKPFGILELKRVLSSIPEAKVYMNIFVSGSSRASKSGPVKPAAPLRKTKASPG